MTLAAGVGNVTLFLRDITMTHKYLQALQEQLPTHEMDRLLDPDPNLCISYKTFSEGYVFANKNFLTLMGLSNLSELIHKQDSDLYKDKKTLQMIRNYDELLYDTKNPLQIEGQLKPIRHPKLIKTMQGISYPIQLNSENLDGLFFMVLPKNKIINLSVKSLCTMISAGIQQLLIRSSYLFETSLGTIRLARMEILCIAEFLKGKHAGEIAEILNIKQATVEAYISNLKNKCGIAKRSELIDFVISNNIFEKIIV